MLRTHRGPRIGLALLAGFATSSALGADALAAVQSLREGGCGGLVPAAAALRHSALLDAVAGQWAGGRSLSLAAGTRGYEARSTAGVHVRASQSELLPLLRRTQCRTLTDAGLREIGRYSRGSDTWLVLASATAAAPSRTSAPPQATSQSPPTAALAARALMLVNDARARGTRCGRRQFAPAPSLSLSGTLAGVAFGHAADMAAHNYFEHQDLAGHTPADRVRAVGYQEKLVGENIAYGPQTVEEAVRGWLDSPGHCENLMDARFAEMGVASAPGRRGRHGLYWVQVLAAPRAG